MPKCATAAYELSPGTIQVWQIDLSIDAIQAQSCREMLSNDENQRASRFHFEKDKLRFVASRAALRTILSRYLNLAPKELAFSYGIHGKPELAPPLSESALTFNLSHSRERALLAISINSRIGADIEYVDQQFASDEIAEHFFFYA